MRDIGEAQGERPMANDSSTCTHTLSLDQLLTATTVRDAVVLRCRSRSAMMLTARNVKHKQAVLRSRWPRTSSLSCCSSPKAKTNKTGMGVGGF